ncbi:MAG: hypothetical protein ACI8TX_003682 [Hyphomicrobiaceae bacterium]
MVNIPIDKADVTLRGKNAKMTLVDVFPPATGVGIAVGARIGSLNTLPRQTQASENVYVN